MLSRTDTKIKVAAILIALISVIVYLPGLQNDFVNWDDNRYVYENPDITSIDTKFIKWMFTTFKGSNWHPLTWLSHAVDYKLWELNPLGHHLTSIILHGLNSFLVVILITVLITAARGSKEETNNTGALIASAVTGLLFALHPVHVESVAWVSERKDVLCAFFFLLSIFFYLRYAQEGKGHPGYGSHVTCYRRYGLSLLFFILALMSKPMAVTLPLVLLILDIYPLKRVEGWRKLITEKIPFFLLSAALLVVTVMAQKSGGALKSFEHYPFWERLLVGIKAPVFYLYKMLWPAELVPIYPYPSKISLLTIEYTVYFALIVSITVFCILIWKRHRVFAAAWAYYIVTLLPVLGIVQTGGQAAADRYTYLPSIGPFVLAGLGAPFIWEKVCGKESLMPRVVSVSVIAVLILVILPVLTVMQTGIWKDSLTLWNREIEKFPNLYRAYNNRGKAYEDLGEKQRAIKDYNKAIKLNPLYELAYYNRGLLYAESGDYQYAIEDFDIAIKINPGDYLNYINRGTVYAILNNFQKALEDYNTVIKLNPSVPAAYYNRGLLFISTSNYQEAIIDLNKTLELSPQDMQAYYYRGLAYDKLQKHDHAILDFQTAARLGDKSAQKYLASKGIIWQQ